MIYFEDFPDWAENHKWLYIGDSGDFRLYLTPVGHLVSIKVGMPDKDPRRPIIKEVQID